MIHNRKNTENYRALFLNDTPLVDVRAPVEFAAGAFPCAVNLPLMEDEERRLVGICYKKKGAEEALALGHQLVQGQAKARRVKGWQTFVDKHPLGYLYCFRGGLRSKITQNWLNEGNTPYPCVEGGYKAMRRFLLDELEKNTKNSDFIILCGKTGCGKTDVINQVKAIDLEALANHRGSSFGRKVTNQPSQINFENALSIALLRKIDSYETPLILEDESRTIGRSFLPISFYTKMSKSPFVLLEEPLDSRVERVLQEYVIRMSSSFNQAFGNEGQEKFSSFLLEGLHRIAPRLGQQRYDQLKIQMNQALARKESGDLDGHREWISELLQNYYDPMYEYQLQKKTGHQFFSGNHEEVLDWFVKQQKIPGYNR